MLAVACEHPFLGRLRDLICRLYLFSKILTKKYFNFGAFVNGILLNIYAKIKCVKKLTLYDAALYTVYKDTSFCYAREGPFLSLHFSDKGK